MRRLSLLAPLALLAGGPDLVTDYGKPRTLRTTSKLALELETVAMEMRVDDEPADDRGPGGMSSKLERRAVIVDQVQEGAPGEPARVRRTFEELHDDSTFSFGEEERSDERDYPLQGLTLALAREEDGTVACELADGTPPDDEALLEDHELALALDALLPPAGTEAGGKWELDDETVKRALAPALDRRLFADPPPEGRDAGRGGPGGGRGPRGGTGRSLGLVAWTGQAELVALDEEHEGEPCARIALRFEGAGEVPEPNFRGEGRGFGFDPAAASLREGKVEALLEGEFFYSLAHARPRALELEGELRIENRFEREREGRRFSMYSEQAGTVRWTVQVEEAE
jgi:hypothetical protein